jgi:hypothetical protein
VAPGVTAPETCFHGGVLYYRDRCPHPLAHTTNPTAARPAVRRHLDPSRLRLRPGTVAGDRELALRTLMPRHRGNLPSWEDLTDSQRAEVTRLVEAFAIVRQAFEQERRERPT